MATFTSYDAVGIKEDISDIITNISPTKTPFQSSIGREKITQKLYQWQEDSLRAAASNAQIEGFDASFITVNPTVMRSNNTQILAEAVQVSGSLEATSEYGRARESAYQLAKSAAQVKRDLEVALVGNDQAAVAGSDAAARKTASYSRMITDSGNVVRVGTAATPIDETHMLTALQNAYNNGAEPSAVYVTPANSLNIAAFAKAAGRFRNIQDNSGQNKQMVNAVDLYVSPFGEVRIYINRFQNGSPLSVGTGNSWTLVVDPDMWVLCTLRPWFREVLAKTGDSIKQMIVGEFGLKSKNFLGSSLVVDNAPAAGTF